ncbi:MAG: hypothetical protein FJX74_12960 [Armatimonadetes bacterium]|nr:hypothetical protein [Armatimonadota bacterium]
MRSASARLGLVLLMVSAVSAAFPQEPPAVDLTDPVAVVQAYSRACREADVAAALALLAPDDPAQVELRELEANPERGGPRQLGDMIREYLLVPMGVPVEQEVTGSSEEGDRAEVKLSAVARSEQTFVLARQPDGTWRVRLIDTLRASAPDGNSFLAAAFEHGPGSSGGGGPETWQSESNLRQLYQALQQYANDHGNALPPAERWLDEIEPYVLERAALDCPIPDVECCYAMNADLSGAPLPDDRSVRESTVLLFEHPGRERNTHATAADPTKLARPRPDGRLVLITASGQTMALEPGQKVGGWQQAEEAAQRCSENLRALVAAARKYAIDHDGLLPKAESWETDLEPYIEAPNTRSSGSSPALWESRNRLQTLYKALVEYSRDHADRLPPADRWMDEVEPYVLDADAFRCPAAPELESGFAMNEALSEQPLPQDWQDRRRLLVLFEWAGGERNARASQDAAENGPALQPDGTRVAVSGDGNAVVLPPGFSVADLVEGETMSSTCSQNLAYLAGAARRFARDNDGLLPAADTWAEDLAPYLIDAPDPNALFVCPAAPELEYAYAINDAVAGHNTAEFRGRGNTVLFFESDQDRPSAAGPTPGGRGRRCHIDYWNAADGMYDNLAQVNGDAGRSPLQPHGARGDLRRSVLSTVLVCSGAPGMAHPFAMNAAVAGRNATELTNHGALVVFFESDLNVPNATGDPQRDGAGRHHGWGQDRTRYTQVGYLNGSATRVPFVAADAAP